MRKGKYLAKRRWFGGLSFLLIAHPVLTAVACVLALAVSLLGTYAWLAFQATTDPETFTTAKLSIELGISEDKTVIKRFASDPGAIEAQFSLIGDPNDETRIDVDDEVLAAWLEEYTGNLATILTVTDKAAPMSFAFRSYTLTNGSSVPIYFRIDKARLSGQYHEIALNARYQIESTDDVSREGTLISDDEEVLYCKEPLYSGDSITVTFVVYLRDIKPGKYTLSSEYAEIIQATNNAVFMPSGWEDVAEQLESYIK